MSVDEIFDAIAELTPADRGRLFNKLALRYSPLPEEELTPELKALLDERVAEADANPDGGYSMEEVIAYVKRKT